MIKNWEKEEDQLIRDNIHLTNAQIAELFNGTRTKAAVADRVRKLGLTRTFTKLECEILCEVWGKPRVEIEAALTRWNWRQISKKAGNLGLPLLSEERDSILLYSLVDKMGYGDATVKAWIKAGLSVFREKASNKRHVAVWVKYSDLWDFMLKNKEIVDFARLPELFNLPEEIRQLRQISAPFKKIKRLTKVEFQNLLDEYFKGVNTKELAVKYNKNEDYIRSLASKYNVDRTKKKKRKLSPHTLTNEVFDRLCVLRLVENKTVSECAKELGLSKATIYRALALLNI